MGFSLAAKFTSECLAMLFAMFLGTSAVANELLPSTKGHAMGYFGTAVGFSFAFNSAGAWFGGISAQVNPAMFLYLAIRGKLEDRWVEFVVGSAADFLGAFIGGCLTYFYWAPHFWTVPLPPDPNPVSNLLHGPTDALSSDAGRLASAFGANSRPPQDATLRDEVVRFGERLVTGGGNESSRKLLDLQVVNDAVGSEEAQRVESTYEDQSERIDVSAVQDAVRHRRGMLSRYLPVQAFFDSSAESTSGLSNSTHSNENNSSQQEPHFQDENSSSMTTALTSDHNKRVRFGFKSSKKNKVKKSEIRDAAYEAAVQADQAAKLSIFATRPARYNRVANFLQEMIATVVLIVGIQMFNLRLESEGEGNHDTPFVQTVMISFFVTSLVLGLGGTTGFAVNPARDLGPRLAHQLLPIPGKGPSEWHYGWVPVAAPFCGALIAAAIMVGMEAL